MTACVDGILFSAAGWWPPLSDAEIAILALPRRRAMLMIAGELPGPHGSTTAELERTLGLPSVRDKLQSIRLRYAARLARSAPDLLRLLIDAGHADAWMSALVADLESMRLIMHEKLAELSEPAASLQPWIQLWRLHPTAWTALVSKFEGTIAQRRRRADPAPRGEDRPELGDVEHAADEIPAFCPECEKPFPTHARLAAHRFAAHGVKNPFWAYVQDGTCPVCKTRFWSRPRVVCHLRDAPACGLSLLHNGTRIDEHEQDRLDASDAHERSRARGLGSNVYEAFRPCQRPRST